MKKWIVKSIVFCVICGCILISVDKFFVNGEVWSRLSFSSFYDTKNPDILLIGNSHLNYSIDTYILDSKTKSTSIKLVAPDMNIARIYYNLLEACNKSNPKLVIIENWSLLNPSIDSNDLFDNEGYLIKDKYDIASLKHLGEAKYKETIISYPENRVLSFFNIFKNHDLWTNSFRFLNGIKGPLMKDAKYEQYKFTRRNSFKYLSQNIANEFEKGNYPISEIYLSQNEKLFLKKIIDLSIKNDFKLLFLTVPVYNTYYKKVKVGFNNFNKNIKKFISPYSNTLFLDINERFNGLDRYNIRSERTANHNQHLNYSGAIKTSVYLSNFINSNYGLIMDTVINRDTAYDILYDKNRIEKDTLFEGYLTKFNGKVVSSMENNKELYVRKNESNIIIEGYMYYDGLDMTKVDKIIAFRKEKDDFIYFSSEELNERKAYTLIEKEGDKFKNSGYLFKIHKNILGKGRYKVFQVIRDSEGTWYIQDPWKWVIVE